jgi:uncharacterized membrane protein YeaQ/YmgE (transglycosylase-associated protein family)
MLEVLSRAIDVDTFTLLSVAALSGWAGLLLMFVQPKRMLALALMPGFVVGALAANYFFLEYGVYLTSENETNFVLASTIGVSVALLIMIALLRLMGAINKMRLQSYKIPH